MILDPASAARPSLSRTKTNTKVLCTLGPGSLHQETIAALEARGVDLFRINLSHTPVELVAPTLELIRQHSAAPVCLDTQGAQVRCGAVADAISLTKAQVIKLTAEPVIGTVEQLTLWPESAFESMEPGSLVAIDFDGALLKVIEVGPGHATATVIDPGRVCSNRAVTIEPAPALPALTDQDLAAIEVGREHGVKHFALSFASNAPDVDRLRRLAGPDAYVIAKIESRAGVRNMDEIISVSDAVLIDRGDLSREIPLEHVPMFQKEIIRRANRASVPTFVATNLLESMVRNRRPTIAEANDIINTLADGAHGLVLAAETAVGMHPVASVDMVIKVIQAFEQTNWIRMLDPGLDSADLGLDVGSTDAIVDTRGNRP